MKLPLLLIPLIFLSSCTIDWNDEKDAKIAELEKQVTELKEELGETKNDESFKKQQECQKYLSKMADGDENRAFNGDFTNRVFYSQIKNGCIYQSKIMVTEGNRLTLVCYLTKDAFTNEDYTNYCIGLSGPITQETFDKAEDDYNKIFKSWQDK